MVCLLVVDDDPRIGSALKSALRRGGTDVLVAHTGRGGLELAREASPDLMIVDLRLPDMDGVEVVRQLRRHHTVPVLVASAVTEETRRVEALDAGADDYLTKPFGLSELEARLRALLRRTGPAGAQEGGLPLLTFGELVVDLERSSATRDGQTASLTPTEWRILAAFVSHPGKLLTHRWLLTKVWNQHYGDESRQALRAHIRSLRAKIGDSVSAPRYIGTESGAGYRWLATAQAPPATYAAPGVALPEPEPGTDAAAVTGTGTGEAPRHDAIVHELSNVLTALHFAVFLATPRLTAEDPCSQDLPGAETGAAIAERLDSLTRQASELLMALEGRARSRAGAAGAAVGS